MDVKGIILVREFLTFSFFFISMKILVRISQITTTYVNFTFARRGAWNSCQWQFTFQYQLLPQQFSTFRCFVFIFLYYYKGSEVAKALQAIARIRERRKEFHFNILLHSEFCISLYFSIESLNCHRKFKIPH